MLLAVVIRVVSPNIKLARQESSSSTRTIFIASKVGVDRLVSRVSGSYLVGYESTLDLNHVDAKSKVSCIQRPCVGVYHICCIVFYSWWSEQNITVSTSSDWDLLFFV